LWRAAGRFADVLLANLATELSSDAPAGINVSAPSAAHYYILADAASVETHAANGSPRCYLYFAGDQTRTNYTRGPTTRPSRQKFDLGVAFHVVIEGGAGDFSPSWKSSADPQERELRRVLALLGAANDVIDGNIRDGDDVMDAQLVRMRPSPPTGSDQPDRGTWAHAVWTVDQKINRNQQN
jgi:hypothetical protein